MVRKGRELLAGNRIFREKIEQCSALLEPLAGWSLVAELSADEAQSRLNETAVAQPAIFALQVALAAVWESWGVVPAAVAGHSVVGWRWWWCCGRQLLEEAMRVASPRVVDAIGNRRREDGVGRAHGGGSRTRRAAARWPRLGGRGQCGPVVRVVWTNLAQVDEVIAGLQARDVVCRPLPVNYAFHSAQMDRIARETGVDAGAVVSQPPRCRWC